MRLGLGVKNFFNQQFALMIVMLTHMNFYVAEIGVGFTLRRICEDGIGVIQISSLVRKAVLFMMPALE